MMATRSGSFSRSMRGVLLFVATAMAVVVGVAGGSESRAAETFNPGNIISDAIFYKSTSMSVADIEAFIAGKGANCVPGKDGSVCLKDFRQDTTTRAATARCTSPYVGGANESAAAIISKVSQACGINPQVLLVMLQKEQGLITASGTGLTLTRYQKAMGYACPDTAACDAQYFGFQNQVYSAASQLKGYALTPDRWNHKVGVINNVRYHPNAACGTSPVLIQNQATASLYNYTPYQPNAAALAAGSGTGDNCSSYGNRNFYNYFTLWFGQPLNQAPIGVVDSVSVSALTLTVSGWTIDPDTSAPIQAHIYVDGVGVNITANRSRPDLVPIYGLKAEHGFSYSVQVAPGVHSVCVFGINATPGANTLLDCREVTAVDQTPIGAVELISNDSTSLTVSGWSMDPDTPERPNNVHIYIDGSGVSIPADKPHARGPHGFSYTAQLKAGEHDLCVYSINTWPAGNTVLACQKVFISDHAPIGVIDSIKTTNTSLTVTGWALDQDTTAPIPVHIYVDGVGVNIQADLPRPDLVAYYNRGANHGYTHTFPVGPGPHQVCVYGINATPGPNTLIDCQTVTVADLAPIGSLDTATTTATSLTVRGWVLDPDTSDPISSHIYVDGVGVNFVADLPRPDLIPYFNRGANHGFNKTFAVGPGSHQVCVYGINSTPGPNTLIECRNVTISDFLPIGVVDSVTVAPSSLSFKGWALDQDTSDPIATHIYVDGVGVNILADQLRRDLVPLYNRGANHGFTYTFTVAPGEHSFCVYAINPDGGSNTTLKCGTVQVP